MNGKPDLGKVLEHYDVDVPDRGGWVKIKCPIHEDLHASATCNIDEQAFACFACDVKGDVYTLIMAKEKMGFLDAVQFGKSHVDGGVPAVLGQSERGLLGLPVSSRNTGSRRKYVPPRRLY